MAERDDVLELAKIARSEYGGGPYINSFITRLESQREAEDATPPPPTR